MAATIEAISTAPAAKSFASLMCSEYSLDTLSDSRSSALLIASSEKTLEIQRSRMIHSPLCTPKTIAPTITNIVNKR